MTKKVLIIGGGPGGLSTAWELVTAPRAESEPLEVRVATLGWRLGGKAATGRGPNGRIQEHGIHGFAGFYDNATNLIEGAYQELFGTSDDNDDNRPAPGQPPKSVQHALIPDDYSIDFLYNDGKALNRALWFPHNDGAPWDGDGHQTLSLDAEQVIESLITMTVNSVMRRPLPTRGPLWHVVEGVARAGAWVSRKLIVRALLKATADARDGKFNRVEKTLDRLARVALGWRLKGEHGPRSHATELDFVAAFVRGLLKTRLLGEHGHELDVDDLDHLDYVEWLRQNGISEATLKTGLPHSPALICFQFANGDVMNPPSMSASSYIGWTVRLALSKGSTYLFFALGSGETIVGPVYQALRKRGVEFDFFHKLTQIVPSDDGTSVERVVFRRQARLRPGLDRYEPMTRVPGVVGDYDVWPATPLWDQLHPDDAAAIQAAGDAPGHPADLESYWSAWHGVDDIVLERGVDFDEVVLAIPPTAFPYVCSELLASSPVLQKATGLQSCATVGTQLWLDKTAKELGFPEPIRTGRRTIGASFVDPFNVVVDFSDLIAYEGWGASAPKSLLYLCGPIPDRTDPLAHDFSDHRVPAIELEKGLVLTAQYLASAALWLPGAAEDQVGDNLGLDVTTLHVDDPALRGIDRLAAQYLKVNIDPSERYIMAMPGTAKARPRAWGAEAKNLTLAGDWIYTGINVGSFEGAVMSGRLASYAITGFPKLDQIPGYGLLHRASLLDERRA